MKTIRDALEKSNKWMQLFVDCCPDSMKKLLEEDLKKNKEALEIPLRNCDMYPSRHAAYLAFKQLKPIPHWFEDDGINAFICVDFQDWLLLPVRESNRYTNEDLVKFIR